jgi:hypothetical protein
VNDDELLDALGGALAPPPRAVPEERLAELRAHLAATHASTGAPPADDGDGDGRAEVVSLRGRRTVLLGTVAAAVGAIAGGAATAAALAGRSDADEAAGPPLGEVAIDELRAGATATATTIDHTWGAELLLDIEGLPEGRSYAVTFATADGPVSAGGFRSVPVLMRCRFNATSLLADVDEMVVEDEASGEIVLRARPV